MHLSADALVDLVYNTDEGTHYISQCGLFECYYKSEKRGSYYWGTMGQVTIQPTFISSISLLSFVVAQIGAASANSGSLDDSTGNSGSNENADSQKKSKDTLKTSEEGTATKATNTNDKESISNYTAETKIGTTTATTAVSSKISNSSSSKSRLKAATGEDTSNAITYNQWGFTGSQSRWTVETVTSDSDKSSSPSVHSIHTTEDKKSSNAAITKILPGKKRFKPYLVVGTTLFLAVMLSL